MFMRNGNDFRTEPKCYFKLSLDEILRQSIRTPLRWFWNMVHELKRRQSWIEKC
ncbi:MAG: hypothetical protein ACTS4U_00550 [Candidatus Hodgkinia cicadicola]